MRKKSKKESRSEIIAKIFSEKIFLFVLIVLQFLLVEYLIRSIEKNTHEYSLIMSGRFSECVSLFFYTRCHDYARLYCRKNENICCTKARNNFFLGIVFSLIAILFLCIAFVA